MSNLRKGRSFVTNGPLIWFTIDGKDPGEDLSFRMVQKVKFQATLRSIIPVDHLEIVSNGKVVQTFELKGDRRSGDFSGTLPVSESGWYVLRAWNDKPTYPVLDIYPYATTNPVYVTWQDSRFVFRRTGDYFAAWIDRIIEATQSNVDYYSEQEKQDVLNMLKRSKESNMSDVTLIFGKDSCPYTGAARQDYENAGKPFRYINVLQDKSELKRMLEFSKGVREVPVIVENGQVTIGYAGGS